MSFKAGDILISDVFGTTKVHEVRDDGYVINCINYGPVYEADKEWVEDNWRLQTPLEKLL